LALLALLGVGQARAQQASGYAELTVSRSDADDEDDTGRRSGSRNDSFQQRYSLDLSWRLYPNLQLLAGGLFEKDTSTVTTDLDRTETSERRVRPYLNVALRNAVTSALLGFYRNEDATRSPGSSSRVFQDLYNATLGWRPEDLPRVTLRFLRTDTYDAERTAQDTTDDLFDLVSDYQPIDAMTIYYRGALQDFRDHLNDTTIRRASQAGRVTYSDTFWRQRLQFGAEYDVNHRRTDITAGGGGEVASPLFPVAGLSLVTDTPTDGALTPNPLLIDDERTASAGVNLGLPPVGGDERPRNLGLDFGGPVTLNTLSVWIDRDLPVGIADTFSWDVYSSSDNLTWALQQTVFPAPFGPFDHRFEIRFTELTTRYVKVVTRPLARTVSMADQFPDILVTELVATERLPAAEVEGRTEQTSQLVTTNLQARLTERPALYYEFAYFLRDTGTAPSTHTLTNGLSLRHTFNPIYSTTARLSREDSRESAGNRTAYYYSASLRAVPVPTLQSTVVLSGRRSDLEGQTTRSDSVFLYTNADLYRGVSTTLSVGRAVTEGDAGDRSDTTQINALATLVPHRTLTINLLYQSNLGTREQASVFGTRDVGVRARQASISYTPVTTLYLFFSYRAEDDVEHDRTRFLRNSSTSWTPFPDGSLQILFRYDETYQSDLDALSRIVSPRVRWNITDRFYAEVAYERTTYDSPLNIRTAHSLIGTTRIFF
ncbi:MAG TPA: hypothetical protein VNL37_03930, partial [Candidatus Polarisedimenticolia bacterium]|nr:hypothetical protein [Candidatus Polarisedimenticolia bacterium]